MSEKNDKQRMSLVEKLRLISIIISILTNSTLIAIAGSILTKLKQLLSSEEIMQQSNIGWLIAGVISCFILLIGSIGVLVFFIWKLKSYVSYYYPPSVINYSYTILKRELLYVQSGEHMILRNILNIKLTRPCQNVLVRMDADSNEDMETTKADDVPNNKLKGNPIIDSARSDENVGNIYSLNFNEGHRGDELILAYDCKMPKGNVTTPNLSVNTFDPTKEIVFMLHKGCCKDGSLKFRESIGNTYKYIVPPSEIEIKTSEFCRGTVKSKNYDCIKYSVKSPHRFRYYMIMWDWSQNREQKRKRGDKK